MTEPIAKDESVSVEDASSAGLLHKTLKNHPVVSLATAALVLLLGTVTVTYKVIDTMLIKPLEQRVDSTGAEDLIGTRIYVRRTIDESRSIVVIEGRLNEGETVMSIDGTVVIGVTAIEEDVVTLDGFLLETHNRFMVQLTPEMEIKTVPGLLPSIHGYETTVRDIKDNSVYVVCRCVMHLDSTSERSAETATPSK